MLDDADILPDLLLRLRAIGTAMGNHGTFRMRVLLGMLINEVVGQIKRQEEVEDAAAKTASS